MIKNILLIGKTGSGKSTLANVITDTNHFAESSGSSSKTREIQSENFNIDNNFYQIIDTVGIGDTKLSKDEVLDKIAEAVYLSKSGIFQIFFLIKGKFDPFEVFIYNLLKTIIFDEKSIENTTIIRNKFESFKNKNKVKEDLNLIIESGGDVAKIFSACQERFIHIDNPTLDVECTCDEDEEVCTCDKENDLAINQLSRKASKEIIFNHLKKFENQTNYIPEKLKNLSTSIVKFMEAKIKLKEELNRLESKGKGRKSFELIGSSTENISIVEDIQQITLNKAESLNTRLNNDNKIRKIITFINENIYHLEDELEKLRKEIAQKEQLIRNEIFTHLLNNYQEITKIQGGDFFINQLDSSIKENLSGWEKNNFSNKEIVQWTNIVGVDFKDHNFCKWIKDNKHIDCEDINKNFHSIRSLKEEYFNFLNLKEKELSLKNKSLDYLDFESSSNLLSGSKKRIRKEWIDIRKNVPKGNIISVDFHDDYLSNWIIVIKGPDDSFYKDSLFNLSVSFPSDYPFKPPKIHFIDKIFHPSINSNGSICSDCWCTIKENWSPALNVEKAILLLFELLIDPSETCDLNREAHDYFKTYKENKEKISQQLEEEKNDNNRLEIKKPPLSEFGEFQIKLNEEKINSDLDSIIISIKAKLRSKSSFSSKYREREEKLNNLFNNPPSNSEEFICVLEEIKKKLSERLTKLEIEQFYQAKNEQSELIKSQT